MIQEFIQALDEEIEAIKRGKGGSIVKVFNGRFLREISGLFVYVFNLENFLAVLDECPAEIEIRGTSHPAQVLLTQGLEVEIGIESFCGQFIPEARLQTNLWYLLDLLRRKYAEGQSQSPPPGFHLSEVLFSGEQSNCVSSGRVDACFSPMVPPHTPAQKEAIQKSFSCKLSVVWGPPGTGKTRTVAGAIEAHLNAGHRILLVSHANNAVDEALKHVANHLKTTSFYQEGKLVRLGKPQEEYLKLFEEDYELVLQDRIAAKLGESLIAEKNSLEREKAHLEEVLAPFENAIRAMQMVIALTSELGAQESAVLEYANKLAEVIGNIAQIEAAQAKNFAKLKEAELAGRLRRLLKGLVAQKIRREIDQAAVIIDSKRRLAGEIATRLEELKHVCEAKKLELFESCREADSLIEQLGAPVTAEIVECSRCRARNRVYPRKSTLLLNCGGCKTSLADEMETKRELEELQRQKKEWDQQKNRTSEQDYRNQSEVG